MSSPSFFTGDSAKADLFYIEYDHNCTGIITTESAGGDLYFKSGENIGIAAPSHLLHVMAPNHDERRDDDMLHKSVFLEAVADSHDVKLTREQRQIIKDMDNDDWQYFVARLLLGAELVPLIESFKEEPQLVKVVKE